MEVTPANQEVRDSDNPDDGEDFIPSEYPALEDVSLGEEGDTAGGPRRRGDTGTGTLAPVETEGGGSGREGVRESNAVSPAELAANDAMWQDAATWDVAKLQRGDQPFLVRRMPPTILQSYTLLNVDHIVSARGVRQGDPLGPLLFAVAIQPTLLSTATLLPGVTVVAYADDITIVGPRDAAYEAFKNITRELRGLGLRCNIAKPTGWAAVEGENEVPPPEGLLMSTAGIGVLGSPIGTAEFCTTHAQARLQDASAPLPLIAQLHPQHAMLVLSRSISRRISYLLRTTPAEVLEREEWRAWSETLMATALAAAKLRVPSSELERSLLWRQGTLPVRLGGLGIIDPTSEAPVAYIASITAAQQLLKQMNLPEGHLLSRAASLLDHGWQPEPPGVNLLTALEAERPRELGGDGGEQGEGGKWQREVRGGVEQWGNGGSRHEGPSAGSGDIGLGNLRNNQISDFLPSDWPPSLTMLLIDNNYLYGEARLSYCPSTLSLRSNCLSFPSPTSSPPFSPSSSFRSCAGVGTCRLGKAGKPVCVCDEGYVNRALPGSCVPEALTDSFVLSLADMPSVRLKGYASLVGGGDVPGLVPSPQPPDPIPKVDTTNVASSTDGIAATASNAGAVSITSAISTADLVDAGKPGEDPPPLPPYSSSDKLVVSPAVREAWGAVTLLPLVTLFTLSSAQDSCGRQLAFNFSFAFSMSSHSGKLDAKSSSSSSSSSVSFPFLSSTAAARVGAAAAGDGLAFVISATEPTGGPGMGYKGMGKRSVAVELDTRKDTWNGDPHSNHVGVNVGGSSRSIAAASSDSIVLNSGEPRHVWIVYEPDARAGGSSTRNSSCRSGREGGVGGAKAGRLQVFLAAGDVRPGRPLLDVPLSLYSMLKPSLSRPSVFLSFASSSSVLCVPQDHHVLCVQCPSDPCSGIARMSPSSVYCRSDISSCPGQAMGSASISKSFYRVTLATMWCHHIHPIYGLTLAQFLDLNGGLSCDVPLPVGTVVSVKPNGDVRACSASYTTVQRPRSLFHSQAIVPCLHPHFLSLDILFLSPPSPFFPFLILYVLHPPLLPLITISFPFLFISLLPSPLSLPSFPFFPFLPFPPFPPHAPHQNDTCESIAALFSLTASCPDPSQPCTTDLLRLNPGLDCSITKLPTSLSMCLEWATPLMPMCKESIMVESAGNVTCALLVAGRQPPLSALELYRMNLGIYCHRLLPPSTDSGFPGSEVCGRMRMDMSSGSCPLSEV
ncbi:unnamed protein product [Closterium sp. NIES-65]|nr:unnamed protein product [Closterium sp. NIES-65]